MEFKNVYFTYTQIIIIVVFYEVFENYTISFVRTI